MMFEYGIGVRRDETVAFQCLKEAATRGNVYAQGNLAVHYYRRKLMNKAADVAKRYFFLAMMMMMVHLYSVPSMWILRYALRYFTSQFRVSVHRLNLRKICITQSFILGVKGLTNSTIVRYCSTAFQ